MFFHKIAAFALLGCAAHASSREQHPIGEAGSPLHKPEASDAPAWRDDLLEFHKSLVEISSVTGTENEVGNFLTDYLTEKGYVAQLQFLPPKNNTPAGKDRFNVVAWRGTTRHPKPRVLVTSHIDTVPPYIPYSVDSKGKRDVGPDTVIAGRGTVDAKGSVAAQIIAVEELLAAEEVDAEDVMLLYVVGEETTGDGMRLFSDMLDTFSPPLEFESVIFGEPTENKLACGHKGHLSCTVNSKGKAGHSGYPWLGKSANEVLIRGLVKVLDADLGSSDRYGNTTVNVGLIEGGVAANVIPKSASAVIAVRVAVPPQASGGAVVRSRIEKILADVDEEALNLDCTNGYGAVECKCDVDGFEGIVVNYGTDVPNLKGDHIRYLYGPGSILVAHGDDEAIKVSDLEDSVEGYMKLIKHALGA